MRNHQHRPSHSVSPQIRFERRTLGGVFNQIAQALPKKPSAGWYERSRAEHRRALHPCDQAIQLCREAVRAAVESGDDAVLDATRERVLQYFMRCADAAIDVGVAFEPDVTVTDVVSAQCGAVQAIVAASETASVQDEERACQLSLRVAERARAFGRALGAKLRTIPSPLELWS